MTMGEFLEMGGYAHYVWPSYAAVFVILGGLTAAVLRRNAKVKAELVRLEARAPRRRNDAG